MISKTVANANPNCAETFASLILFGDDLAPAAVSRFLGLPPTESTSKGTKTVAPSGKARIAPTGRWTLETRGQVNSTEVGPHIAWLLDQLEGRGIIPLRIAGVSHAGITCFWVSATGNGGPELSPQILGRLANLQLSLAFDIYFDSSGE